MLSINTSPWTATEDIILLIIIIIVYIIHSLPFLKENTGFSAEGDAKARRMDGKMSVSYTHTYLKTLNPEWEKSAGYHCIFAFCKML